MKSAPDNITPDDASKVSILDLPVEVIEQDKSLEELRAYEPEPEFVVIVTDPEAFYDRLGITG